MIAATKASLEPLQAEAMSARAPEILRLDLCVATQMKLFQGLVAEYERLCNRKLRHEFLRLQVESLRRDVAAINHDKS